MDYVIGKSAEENTHLVQTAAELDVWFHVSNLPSAHLILHNPEGTTLKDLRKQGTIYQMALELKKSSKYRKMNNVTIVYDYCKNITTLDTPGKVQCKPNIKNIQA